MRKRMYLLALQSTAVMVALSACQIAPSALPTPVTATGITADPIYSPVPTPSQARPVNTPTEEITPTIYKTPAPAVITLDNAILVQPIGKTVWSSWRNAQLIFKPNATWIVEPLSNEGIVLHDFHTGEIVKSLPDAGKNIELIIVSPDGSRLAAVSPTDGTVSVWDLESFSNLGIYPFKKYQPASELTPLAGSFSHNNRFLAVSGCLQAGIADWGNPICWYSGAVIYDLAIGEIYKELAGYQASTNSVVFNPNDQVLVFAGQGKSTPRADLLVWNVNQNKLLITLESLSELRASEVKDIHFNCNGDKLATIIRANLVVWDTNSWQPLTPAEGNGPSVVDYSLADCSLLATADGLHLTGLSFWNADKLETISTWETSIGDLYNLAFSPDGRRIYTWSDDMSGRFKIQEWFIP